MSPVDRSHFMFESEPGHEVAFVYAGELADLARALA